MMYEEFSRGELPNKDFRKLVKSTRDPEFKKDIYNPQEQRKIDWPAYNLSQIKQVKETLNFIRESINLSYSPEVRNNATNPRYLVKAILISEMIQSPEREAEGWIEIRLSNFPSIHLFYFFIPNQKKSRIKVKIAHHDIFLISFLPVSF